MSREWYVIHTYSGHENKVKLALEKKVQNLKMQDRIFEVRIPTIEVQEIRDGKKRTKSRKFCPGYVLVEMDIDEASWSDIWGAVKGIPGVTNFVGSLDSKSKGVKLPRPLPRADVESLFDQRGGLKGREKISAVIDFSIGEHIKVVDGPFSNFSGIVEEVYPEKGRVRVKVEIFGRGTPVELDFLQVGKI